jgi:adenylate cyclase
MGNRATWLNLCTHGPREVAAPRFATPASFAMAMKGQGQVRWPPPDDLYAQCDHPAAAQIELAGRASGLPHECLTGVSGCAFLAFLGVQELVSGLVRDASAGDARAVHVDLDPLDVAVVPCGCVVVARDTVVVEVGGDGGAVDARILQRDAVAKGHDWTMATSQTDPAEHDLAAVYRLVGIEPPSLARAEVEALTGVDFQRSVRWWRAMGFPEVAPGEIAFGTEDVEIVKQLGRVTAAGVLSDDDIARLARLMGASFSRLVEAQLEVLPALLAAVEVEKAERVGDPDGSESDDELDVVDFVADTMNYVWRRHLLASLANGLSVGLSDEPGAVGFADLSEFSHITRRASTAEIAEIVDTFEATAFDVVSGHSGRVVKLIGDEVMFVADSFDDAIEISLDLITRLRAVGTLPPVHCGVAAGPTVHVGGDVFGSTVNLASRLAEQARPDSVVVSRRDGEHLLDRDGLDVRAPRRSLDLKGVGRMHVLAIRPLDTDP